MRSLNVLIENKLSPENSVIIHKYDKEMVGQSIALSTRIRNLRALLALTRLVNKSWEDVTKENIDELVFKIMELYSDGSGRETNYTYDLKKTLKIFFRWFKLGSREFKEVGDPAETKHVRMKKVRDKIAREDLLTESDMTRLLHVCGENARDRAFIDCHFEGGTRPGEILNLQIKHVKFDKHGAVLHVDGKTGARTVRLVRSTPNLAAWLAVHPFKDNPDAPLWIMLNKSNYGKPLNYPAARAMIIRRCEMANLSKRVHLNLFRHSEATEAAKFMTEMQMKQRHGWSPASKMAARYVHLVNADVDEAILSHYGIKTEENDKRLAAPKKCHVCDMLNSPSGECCSKCGRPLDLATALKIDESVEERFASIEKKLDSLLSLLPQQAQ